MKVEIGGWSRADGSQILRVEIDEKPVFEIAGVLEPSRERRRSRNSLRPSCVAAPRSAARASAVTCNTPLRLR
jgi:hypothetical protein